MPASQALLLVVLLIALGVVLALLWRRLFPAAPTASTTVPATPTAAPATTAPAPAAAAPRAAASMPAPPAARSAARQSTAPAALSNLASWGYQLQNFDLATAVASPCDLLVIDPATDGDDASALPPAAIARMQAHPAGRRRPILAYLSIGEAESYRSYWDNSWKRTKPEWLLGENPEWKENYAVCFWHPGWQALMCGSPDARLDRILAAGFDGVYLDKCDVVDDLENKHKSAISTRPDLAGDMVAFVAKLSAYGKSRNPNFLVVMQNAEDLLERPALRATLDGVAREELVYGESGPEKLNSAATLADARRLLDLIRNDGKLVLAVEYLDDPAKTRHALETLASFHYVPCISPKNRKLARLTTPPAPA